MDACRLLTAATVFVLVAPTWAVEAQGAFRAPNILPLGGCASASSIQARADSIYKQIAQHSGLPPGWSPDSINREVTKSYEELREREKDDSRRRAEKLTRGAILVGIGAGILGMLLGSLLTKRKAKHTERVVRGFRQKGANAEVCRKCHGAGGVGAKKCPSCQGLGYSLTDFVIRFTCPHCGKSLSVGHEEGGKEGKCPACAQRVMIPQADHSLVAALASSQAVQIVSRAHKKIQSNR